jgi:uncharacterized protein (DUF305 family)
MKSHSEHTEHAGNSHYPRLLIMAIVSFAAMYMLMYSMVDRWANVIHNVNQVYMAMVMAAPMVIIELLIMRGMYRDKRRNIIAITISLALFAFAFVAIRKQAGVGDRQFLKSMIPHHAAAILMVEQTDLKDEELKKLATDIISAQQKEIDFMKRKLSEMK